MVRTCACCHSSHSSDPTFNPAPVPHHESVCVATQAHPLQPPQLSVPTSYRHHMRMSASAAGSRNSSVYLHLQMTSLRRGSSFRIFAGCWLMHMMSIHTNTPARALHTNNIKSGVRNSDCAGLTTRMELSLVESMVVTAQHHQRQDTLMIWDKGRGVGWIGGGKGRKKS